MKDIFLWQLLWDKRVADLKIVPVKTSFTLEKEATVCLKKIQKNINPELFKNMKNPPAIGWILQQLSHNDKIIF